MRSSLSWLAAISLVVCICAPLTIEGETRIDFQPIKDTAKEIIFYSSCSSLPNPPAEVDQYQQSSTQIRHITVYLNPAIQPSKFGGLFLLTFYLHKSATTPWYICTIKAIPTGDFVDYMADVPFTIIGDGIDDHGDFRNLPIHSLGKRAIAEITTVTSPGVVDLGEVSGEGDLPIKITNVSNVSESLGITIQGTAQVKYLRNDYWQLQPASLVGDGKDIHLDAGESINTKISLRPRRLPALLATLHSLHADQPHTEILAVFVQNADHGGVSKSVPASLKIRFAPSLVSLLTTLLAGSLLGTCLAQIVPNAWKGWKGMTVKLGRGALYSLAAWFAALLLVGLGSKFVLFTLDLDPWSILPSAGIGFFVSGGKEALAAMGIDLWSKRSHT